ncbi:MAG: RuBisCO large subunit C-terminal-like domain-containing protein [Clostridiales bacterium]|jgi:2,3-diketo-5-methylthiopentyl-1-phosphate enolase|nr:RuBisCO large subunit C-terminal-like domain-containing protein [Clostridiales bacterium]MCK9350626.1 RuBisCO large subunit C-terminal-like domain-containing protein [Clostridiales bacterium]MDD2572538.1 RuBisCO large subunit C-terminal-like domain-containing protein [Eubacteriales bacterium]MDD3540411.1 RuBisCO large subunit C-terminal-like domain-containing protein [Eubacteriales bacterium]NLG30071.1 ribulose 1,5-bisphosphate carboxylase [Clostridiaceae bacterium]
MIQRLEDVNMGHAFPEVAFSEDYIIATFQARIKTQSIERLALALADEQTTGTWIKVGADSVEKKKRFGAQVVAIYEVPDLGSDVVEELPPLYIVQLAIPMDNIGTSLSMLLTTVFGNISAAGMLKLIDLAFPKRYIEQFTGPKFGVEGIREVLGVKDRPLLNAMIKPNIGWTPEEGAEIFYNAAKGGVDIIKDDELLQADGDFCPLEKRVKLFMEKERQVFEETGERTLYSVNITDRNDKIKENAYRAIEYGANSLMLNTYTAGYGALQMLSEDPNINVPILAHVDFVGAYASSTYTGISAPLAIGKLTRLAGGDFQINGHPWGKFPVPYKVFYRSFKFFTQPWWNIKPMMYACSGGTTQLVVKKMVDSLGTDIILAAGGGVHGHPDGSEAGARSMRQAIDAAINGIDLMEYAKTHQELARMAAMLSPEIAKNFDLMQ